MRSFGSLDGRVSRGIGTQAGLHYYRSPLYLQRDTGYVYGAYGNPVQNPNQTSMFYAEQYHERDTNKYDVWSSAIAAAGQIGTQITAGQYALKGAQIAGSTTATSLPPSSGSSSSGILIFGLVGAVALAGLAYLALK